MGLTPDAAGARDPAAQTAQLAHAARLIELADGLYAGDPADFTAARDAAARAARSAGDRELATALRALRRPTLSAWYVNVAARASLVSLREWLTLGEELRGAQSALDAARVRELSGRRSALEARVIADLVAHLAALGLTAAAPALDEVRATLRAALADPDAARAVAEGRLARPLTYGGFGEIDLSAALGALAAAGETPRAEDAAALQQSGPPEPLPPAPPPRPAPPPPELVQARDDARAALDRATAGLTEAEADVQQTEADLAEAQRQVRLALARPERAARAAERATQALASAEDALAATQRPG